MRAYPYHSHACVRKYTFVFLIKRRVDRLRYLLHVFVRSRTGWIIQRQSWTDGAYPLKSCTEISGTTYLKLERNDLSQVVNRLSQVVRPEKNHTKRCAKKNSAKTRERQQQLLSSLSSPLMPLFLPCACESFSHEGNVAAKRVSSVSFNTSLQHPPPFARDSHCSICSHDTPVRTACNRTVHSRG